ncbi:hypothetical protein ACLGIH_32600 [Streptomyces sp. HMX87]|uniref:hypothetical protein n=1 Tax=Streptomyces sp. HMX87 TaxID=3390849 RepID=UPI003A85B97B
MPAAYDSSRGRQLTKEQAPQYQVLPQAGLVAVLVGEDATYRVRALEAATGRLRWESKPFKSLQQRWAPRLLVTGSGGEEHLVVWSTGRVGGDAVTKAREVYSIDIYRADGSGTGLAPRHLEVPMPTGGRHEVLDGGAGLLLDSTTARSRSSTPAPARRRSSSPGPSPRRRVARRAVADRSRR